MVILKIVLYFVSIILPGLLLVKLFNPLGSKLNIFKIALAYGLGSSFVSIILFFYFFILRGEDSRSLFIIVWGMILSLALVSIFRSRRQRTINRVIFSSKSVGVRQRLISYWQFIFGRWGSLRKWQQVILITLIFFLVSNTFFLLSNVANRPAGQFDSIAMWSFKAKTLYYQDQINFDTQSFIYLGGGGHINYPWQIPLQEFWLYKNLGNYNDLIANWIFFFYFLAMIVLVFSFLKKIIGPFRATIFSFFLFSMPLVFYHSFNAYADLPLAFYILCAVSLFYSWLKYRKKEDFILASIFWGLSFWIKDRAIIFFLAFLVVFLFYIILKRLNWKNLIAFLLISLISAAPWLIFKQIYCLGFSNTVSGLFFEPAVIFSFFSSLFVSYSWNIWWFIVLISGVIYRASILASSELTFLWLFLFVGFSALLGMYIFTGNYSFALDQTSLSRGIVSLVGVSVLAVGFLFQDHKHKSS